MLTNFNQAIMRSHCGGILLSLTSLCFAAPAHADNEALRGKLKLSHVSASLWRADYEFNQPIEGLRFRQIGEYRAQAWKPDGKLNGVVIDKEGETYLSNAGPTTRFSFFIQPYGKLVEGEYAPINQFTDGAASIYMGFFQASAILDKAAAPKPNEIPLKIEYQGLQGETVLPPPSRIGVDPANEKQAQAYAYFGPQQVSSAGAMQVILDPAMPVWMRDTLLVTSAKISGYFESAYQRPLLTPLLMTVALSDLESSGMSIKGGASQGQINFRVSGKQSVIDSPALRDAFSQLIAHEIAHIWQNNLAHEAIGGDAPWIHEGGAEAMSLDAMYGSGLWDKDKFLAMQTRRWNECDKLTNAKIDLASNYRAQYVCGMKRFDDTKLSIVTIWRALIAESERSGKVYSEQMVRDILTQLQNR